MGESAGHHFLAIFQVVAHAYGRQLIPPPSHSRLDLCRIPFQQCNGDIVEIKALSDEPGDLPEQLVHVQDGGKLSAHLVNQRQPLRFAL